MIFLSLYDLNAIVSVATVNTIARSLYPSTGLDRNRNDESPPRAFAQRKYHRDLIGNCSNSLGSGIQGGLFRGCFVPDIDPSGFDTSIEFIDDHG